MKKIIRKIAVVKRLWLVDPLLFWRKLFLLKTDFSTVVFGKPLKIPVNTKQASENLLKNSFFGKIWKKHRKASDPFKKEWRFCFFEIFFSKSHILWNIVAIIKKKNYRSVIDKIFIYRKNQVYWVILWLYRSIFVVWKRLFFSWLTFALSFRKGIVKDVVK